MSNNKTNPQDCDECTFKLKGIYPHAFFSCGHEYAPAQNFLTTAPEKPKWCPLEIQKQIEKACREILKGHTIDESSADTLKEALNNILDSCMDELPCGVTGVKIEQDDNQMLHISLTILNAPPELIELIQRG